ncbi:MAG: hypothetical protein Ct9H300mP10_01990 [Methanobacteriota archaeon]|nr:MAG: hypothetical protein Ct9H300mP10_01990 [Euryarchaeota archaeon]
MSRRLARDSRALVRPRLRLGEPSICLCKTSSCRPRCGSSRWRWTAPESGMCSSRARLPPTDQVDGFRFGKVLGVRRNPPGLCGGALPESNRRSFRWFSHPSSGEIEAAETCADRPQTLAPGGALRHSLGTSAQMQGGCESGRAPPPIAAKLPLATTRPPAEDRAPHYSSYPTHHPPSFKSDTPWWAMVKRVVLARGGALPSSTGLGRAHHAGESLLQRAMVPGWSKVAPSSTRF